jgi:hypothetical protein
VEAEKFVFFGIANGHGFNKFGAFVFEQAEADGDNSPLMFITLDKELFVSLLDTDFFVFKADGGLFDTGEGGDGKASFGEVGGVDFFTGSFFEMFQNFAGDNGSGGSGDLAATSAGNVGCPFLEFPDVGEGFLVLEPALKPAETPFGEVFWADGRAIELGGEDLLDFGEGVEPAQNVVSGVIVFEAAVELVADVVGEASDFADEGAVGVLGFIFRRSNGGRFNDLLFYHEGSLPQLLEKCEVVANPKSKWRGWRIEDRKWTKGQVQGGEFQI